MMRCDVATMIVMFHEGDRELQPPPRQKGFHFLTMRLDGLRFTDDEIVQYAQTLGMTLLSAVREQRDELEIKKTILHQ